MGTTSVNGWVRAGLLILPLYWMLLAYTTRQARPDQRDQSRGLGVATTGASLPTQPIGAAVMALAAGAMARRAVRRATPRPRPTALVPDASDR